MISHGPFTRGELAFIARYPPDYLPGLLDQPQAYRVVKVEIPGRYLSVCSFPDEGIGGDLLTIITKRIYKGVPPT